MSADASRTAGAFGLAAALVAVTLLSGPALAHGSSTTMTEESETYIVTYHTYEFLEQAEWIRIAWNVTNKSSGVREDMSHRSVTYRCYAEGDELVSSSEKALNVTGNNFTWTDQFVRGDCVRLDHTFHLPFGEEVNFSEDVTVRNSPNGGNDPPPGTPAPPAVLVVAGLAGAALGLAALRYRRRRGGGT